MEFIEHISPLFTVGIFFIAFLALLLSGFNAMLSPLKKDIARLEAGQAKLLADIAEIKQMLAVKTLK